MADGEFDSDSLSHRISLSSLIGFYPRFRRHLPMFNRQWCIVSLIFLLRWVRLQSPEFATRTYAYLSLGSAIAVMTLHIRGGRVALAKLLIVICAWIYWRLDSSKTTSTLLLALCLGFLRYQADPPDYDTPVQKRHGRVINKHFGGCYTLTDLIMCLIAFVLPLECWNHPIGMTIAFIHTTLIFCLRVYDWYRYRYGEILTIPFVWIGTLRKQQKLYLLSFLIMVFGLGGLRWCLLLSPAWFLHGIASSTFLFFQNILIRRLSARVYRMLYWFPLVAGIATTIVPSTTATAILIFSHVLLVSPTKGLSIPIVRLQTATIEEAGACFAIFVASLFGVESVTEENKCQLTLIFSGIYMIGVFIHAYMTTETNIIHSFDETALACYQNALTLQFGFESDSDPDDQLDFATDTDDDDETGSSDLESMYLSSSEESLLSEGPGSGYEVLF